MGHRPLRALEEEPQGLRRRPRRGHRGALRSLPAAGGWALHRHRLRVRRDDAAARRARRGRRASRSAPTPPRGSSRTRAARPRKPASRTSRSRSPTRRRRGGSPTYDYAFSRMGTQFFAAPVPAMRAIRGALKPGGRLGKICWRRKDESQFWAETEQVVQRFLSRPEEYEADTCGPGPFSLGNPDTCRGILEAAGFEDDRSPPARLRRTTWAGTWTRRSTRCSRSGRAPS